MKHFTLTVFALLALLFAQAQTTIYSQTFSSTALPAGWQNVDVTGTGAGTWTRKTSAHSFASSTASNGFMIFDADALGNDSKPENADLTTAAINCSANAHVVLEFQQFFQQYQSAQGTVSVSTDGSTWNTVYTVSATTDNPQVVSVDLTAYAANQSTVYLKFNYQGDYDYWWAIDDIKIYEPAPLDISVDKLTMPKYVGLSDQTVTGVITNRGFNTVTSFDLFYTVNGGPAISQTFSGLNIAPFQTFNFNFTQKVAMSTAQTYSIFVESLAPNSGTDANNVNDTASTQVFALSAIPDKNVVIEEFTTVPCGYCPGGTTRVSEILASEGTKAIATAIHAGFGTDGMTITEHSTLAAAFTSAAPTACIDRVYFPGEDNVAIGVEGMGTTSNTWKDKTVERESSIVPALVTASNVYNSGTRQLDVTVTAKFFSAVAGNFRVNCYIVEDSVTGTGSGYDQHSYYHDSPTSLNPWLNVGTTNLGSGTWSIAGFEHRHLVRKFMGGAWGSTGVVPSTTSDGGEYSKTYASFTLPAGWNDSHVKLVAFVHEYNASAKSGKNEILNAVEMDLNGSATQNATPSTYVSGINEIVNPVTNVSLFPNPASDVVTLGLNLSNEAGVAVEISNLLGQTVYTLPQTTLSKGGFKTAINTSTFENGIYFVTIKSNNKTAQTLKFVVSR